MITVKLFTNNFNVIQTVLCENTDDAIKCVKDWIQQFPQHNIMALDHDGTPYYNLMENKQ